MIQRGLHSEYIGFISPLFNAMVTFNFILSPGKRTLENYLWQ